jgi:hypothetical protein
MCQAIWAPWELGKLSVWFAWPAIKTFLTHTQLSEVAEILTVDIRAVQAALGVASRLGFATRITPSSVGAAADLTSSPSLSGTQGVEGCSTTLLN